MPKNAKLFPDQFQLVATTVTGAEDTQLAISDLQNAQWQSRIQQSYAVRSGLLAAIRAQNATGITILNKVLPTRLIGRFTKERDPESGTQGYIFGGYQHVRTPTLVNLKNDWIHKFEFQSGTLFPRSVVGSFFHQFFHADATYGTEEVGFFRYYTIYNRITFDTDTLSRIGTRGFNKYISGGLKGRVNGYSVGGSRGNAETYGNVCRFSYDGLLETILANRVQDIPRSRSATVGNEFYGFIAGGRAVAGLLPESPTIDRLTYFGEILSQRSVTLSIGGIWTGSWQPGTKDVGYFCSRHSYRRFPTGAYPYYQILEENTDKLNLNTEVRTVIAAKLDRPRHGHANLSSDVKGWIFGGMRLTVPFANQPNYAWSWNPPQVTSGDTFTFSSETWTALASSLSQPVRYPYGLDNQIR
jgi:hypothetical protein